MAFDEHHCIRLLLDRTTDEATRIAAAESLMHATSQAACDALFHVVMDDDDEPHIRKEAAGSLGTLWLELGTDYDRLLRVPPAYLPELLADYPLMGVKLDRSRLHDAEPHTRALLLRLAG